MNCEYPSCGKESDGITQPQSRPRYKTYVHVNACCDSHRKMVYALRKIKKRIENDDINNLTVNTIKKLGFKVIVVKESESYVCRWG